MADNSPEASTQPLERAVVKEQKLPDGRILVVTRRPIDPLLLPEFGESERLRAAPDFAGMAGQANSAFAIDVSLSPAGGGEGALLFTRLVKAYPRYHRLAVMDIQLRWPHLLLLTQEPPAVMNLIVVPLLSTRGEGAISYQFCEADWNPGLAMTAPVNWVDPKRVEMKIVGTAVHALSVVVSYRRTPAAPATKYELHPSPDSGRMVLKLGE